MVKVILWPWSNVTQIQYFKTFSSETAGPIEAKFHVKPPWDWGMKIYSNGPGHMTKMAAMPISGKNLKKILLRNRKANDLEYWYTVLGTQVLHYGNVSVFVR